MGRPKAGLLVRPGGSTFAAALAKTLLDAGLAGVTVVAGAHPRAVRASLLGQSAVRVVDNPDWPAGQLSSLRAALDALEAEDGPALEAILVALVDSPFVRVETVRTLVARWRGTGAPIVRPAIGDRHGHPVIFGRATFEALRSAPLTEGAKAVIAAWRSQVLNVPVDDLGVLRDIDTPADYDAATGGAG